MKSTTCRLFLGACLLLAAGLRASADRFELADGSVVLGRLVTAEAGKFRIETAFAGTIEIAQDKIKSFATDEAVHVGLAAGREVLGRVTPAGDGIQVAAPGGPLAAPVGRVATVWRQGADSPAAHKRKEEAARMARHWAYETSLAMAGRTGAAEKFGANLGFKATRENAQDKLILGFQAERARDNGIESADRDAGFADYSAFITEKNVWYARLALERDLIKDLNLRSTTGLGYGYKLIKSRTEDLEFRTGASYVYESYTNHTRFDSPGLDIALLHTRTFRNSKLVNSLTYTPAFKDFSNYHAHHESSLELPLVASLWKIKIGLANDYVSLPPDGAGRLDTTYFTSLLVNWK